GAGWPLDAFTFEGVSPQPVQARATTASSVRRISGLQRTANSRLELVHRAPPIRELHRLSRALGTRKILIAQAAHLLALRQHRGEGRLDLGSRLVDHGVSKLKMIVKRPD